MNTAVELLRLNSVSIRTEMTRQDAKCSGAKPHGGRSRENSKMRERVRDGGLGWTLRI